jgi:hypothetical protein
LSTMSRVCRIGDIKSAAGTVVKLEGQGVEQAATVCWDVDPDDGDKTISKCTTNTLLLLGDKGLCCHRVAVRDSQTVHGRGLFAVQDVDESTVVATYTGRSLVNDEGVINNLLQLFKLSGCGVTYADVVSIATRETIGYKIGKLGFLVDRNLLCCLLHTWAKSHVEDWGSTPRGKSKVSQNWLGPVAISSSVWYRMNNSERRRDANVTASVVHHATPGALSLKLVTRSGVKANQELLYWRR